MKKVFEGQRSQNCQVRSHLDGYSTRPHKIVLSSNIVKQVDKEKRTILSMQKTPLYDTPHFQYIIGNKDVYGEYLSMLKYITWARAAINQEHLDLQFMFDKYDKMLHSDHDYLQPPYEDSYIICDSTGLIQDGLHRATILLSNSVLRAPVAMVR